MQVVTTPGVARQLVRCASCAEGDVPPDLPALIEQRPTGASTQLPFASVASMARAKVLDVKQRQVGEREPGEDDV